MSSEVAIGETIRTSRKRVFLKIHAGSVTNVGSGTTSSYVKIPKNCRVVGVLMHGKTFGSATSAGVTKVEERINIDGETIEARTEVAAGQDMLTSLAGVTTSVPSVNVTTLWNNNNAADVFWRPDEFRVTLLAQAAVMTDLRVYAVMEEDA